MKSKIFGSLLFIITLSAIFSFAQTAPKPMYQIGETLTYEGNFSKLILRGLDIAELNFKVEQIPDSENFVVKSEAVSKGTITKLFNFKFYQGIESIVDGEKMHILKTAKRDEQNDRIRTSEAVFDYKSDKVTYVETDPNNLARPPRIVASRIDENTQDFVSAIYAMRRLPLKVGETFEINVSDSGLVYKVPVRVTAREKQKSVVGKKWCFRLEPEVFGKDRLIEKEGNMIIWITDDARRLPVRAHIYTEIGKVVVKLKKVEIIKQKNINKKPRT